MAGEMDHAWFCPQCGLRDETNHGIDGDGTCSSCGCDCCTWNSLSGHLSADGLHIVTGAERKVLEACAAIPDGSLHEWRKHVLSSAARDLWDAELARRGGTELPHGIPESVTKGRRND
jgi:hypothetical protein